MKWCRLDLSGLEEGKVAVCCEKGNKILDSVECGEFLLAEKMSDSLC